MAFKVQSEDALPPNVVAALRAQGQLPAPDATPLTDAATPPLAPSYAVEPGAWRELREGGRLVDAATGKVYAVTEVESPPANAKGWTYLDTFLLTILVTFGGAVAVGIWQAVFGA
jgi:hypothetical protein